MGGVRMNNWFFEVIYGNDYTKKLPKNLLENRKIPSLANVPLNPEKKSNLIHLYEKKTHKDKSSRQKL